MQKITVSLESVLARNPCMGNSFSMSEDVIRELFNGKQELTVEEVVDKHIPDRERLWTLLHSKVLNTVHLYQAAINFARHAVENSKHERFKDTLVCALETYQQYLGGETSWGQRLTVYEKIADLYKNTLSDDMPHTERGIIKSVLGAGYPNPESAARNASAFARRSVSKELRESRWQLNSLVELAKQPVEDETLRRLNDEHARLGAPVQPMDDSLNNWMYIYNKTVEPLRYTIKGSETYHGNTDIKMNTINPSSTAQVYAHAAGKQCAEAGTEGIIVYNITSNVQLVVKWNIPYTYSLLGDNVNPYFYACLQGDDANQYMVSVSLNPNVILNYCESPDESEHFSYTTNLNSFITLSKITSSSVPAKGTPGVKDHNIDGMDSCTYFVKIQNNLVDSKNPLNPATGIITLNDVMPNHVPPDVAWGIAPKSTVIAIGAWESGSEVYYNMPNGDVLKIIEQDGKVLGVFTKAQNTYDVVNRVINSTTTELEINLIQT